MNGSISWMAGNRVAANLLMLFIVLIGFVSVFNIVQEVFPEASLDAIQIRVPYPGASPEEVEEGIVRRIEEQLEGIDGIRRITSVAAENIGVVTAQLKKGADASRILDEIKAEIDRITTFPDDAEEPEVIELTNRRQVIQLALHGNVSEKSLKELAHRVKDDLTAIEGISYVRVNAVRNYEISIEVSEETLRAYGLSLDAVTLAVRQGSLDLPGGSIDTRREKILIRTKGQNYTANDFRDIIVLARPDGATVRLRDIATVRDDFEETDLIARFDGEPTSIVEVYRTADERVLDIADEVYAYVEAISVPEGISVDIWQDEAKLLRSRYELMLKNGSMGLLLVLLALGLFMNSRLAFWVSAGIFISFLGTFAVMIYLGVTLNLISLVAFILALGIVVDDAIVIGENIFAEQERGLEPLDASVKGTVRLVRPVVFAVLTTMVAFAPLLFVPGVIGKFMQNLPLVIITVLGISLIESLYILPAHLSHFRATRTGRRKNPVTAQIERIQAAVARAVEWNINGPLDKILRFSTRHYGLVIVSAISAILLSVGLVAGGFIKFTFFPDIAGENVIARLEMPSGTPTKQTASVAAFIEKKGREVFARMQEDLPEDHPPLVKHVLSVVGTHPSISNTPVGPRTPGLIEGHIAEVNFELLASEERDIPTEDFEEAWREAVGAIPGVKTLEFQSALMSFGKPIQIEMSAPEAEMLDRAVDEVRARLREFAGVNDIEDDREAGKREVKLELKPRARSLGVTLEDLARQVRAAYYGNEALRIQRGRDDIRVMVRLPRDERDALADMDDLRIRTPQGAQIPLSEVATAKFGFGLSSINRRDRRRVVTLTANVNEEIVTAGDVIAALQESVFPAVTNDYPGFQASFEGEQREQADALSALRTGFLIALFVIYALLAIPFRSYTQPFIIMAAIPFGVIGAIIGHLVMGINVGILSLFGIIGLSGVVVNDSLVLIDYINREKEAGASTSEAVVSAGTPRFRPILLTSLTTFL
ncbi:MAG: efflux RND transporter permease subunit, partial [Bacteroidetes bacterium]|nr:efflux RND transporter permease subunit [Bacteroidota bacterium]